MAVVDLGNLKRIVEHRREDQVISVETGMKLSELDRFLAQNGQWLPLSKRIPDASLFEMLNDGDGGCLEHAFGGPRHLALGLHVVTAGGFVMKTGGRVVKNVTGYDMTKLFLGSRASLGIPAVAHFRLFARPEKTLSFLFSSLDAHSICALISRLNASGLPFSCLEFCAGNLLSITRTSHSTDLRGLPDLDKKSHLVFVQVHGHSSVIAEVAPQVKNVVARSGNIEVVELDDTTGEGVAVALSSSCSVKPNVVATSTLRFVENYIRHRHHQHMPLQYRAASGRLRLFPTAALFHDTIDELKKMAIESGTQISFAYGDDEFVYRSLSHPEDRGAGRITASLKEKFDPYKRLNPAVSL